LRLISVNWRTSDHVSILADNVWQQFSSI